MTTQAFRAPAQVPEAEFLADQIASAVRGCADVAGLTVIPGIPVATYLPGRTVSGVAVRSGEVEVSVVARYGLPLAQIAEQVRQAVAPLAAGRVVDVVIADITSQPPERPKGRKGRKGARRPSPGEVTPNGGESANG